MEAGWEEPDCLLCGSRDREPLVEAPDPLQPQGPRFGVVRCRACGLAFTSPRPGPTAMARFYPADYGPHRVARLSPVALQRLSRLPAWCRARDPYRYGIPRFGAGRWLDVGCGGGEFLQRMCAGGWDVQGLDVSATTVTALRDELGIAAVCGTLPSAELPPGRFDGISLWQSLEHFHQPLPALQCVRRLLAPRGRLYLAVPNFAGGPARCFGPAWFGLDLPRHLAHFTPDTLRRMLEAAGFEHPRIRQLPQRAWLQESARLAARQGIPVRGRAFLESKLGARLATQWFQLRGGADCLLATGGG